MKKSVNILLFGAPGAGKGTQAVKLALKYGLNHISTGEVIREEIASGSELGRSMEDYIARGELAPDELVIGMIADFVESHHDAEGNIFDGFPRTLAQAEAFDKIMERHGITVGAMVCLELSDEESVKRLLLRGLESGRADDFSMKAILRRLEIYHKTTEIVAGHYAAQGKLRRIDGMGSIEEVFGRLCDVVDELQKTKA